MRASNVNYLVKKGISSVWKNFIMSFASFSILLVSLLQISMTVLVMLNLNIVMGNIEDTNEIAIFVKDGATNEEIEHIRSALESNKSIADVKHYSKEEAFDKFTQQMGEYSDLLEYLEENPMPETFFVRVNDIKNIRGIVEQISSINGVEKVNAPYDFAGALINIRNTFTVIIAAILLVLTIVSVVIVSNTIRTSVFSRRSEIKIMKYVGATNGFIKLPFFVEGCFVGVLAGAAAWGLSWFIYDSVFSLFTDNLTLWEMFGFFDLIPFGNVSWIVLLSCCFAGAALGTAGTMISMGKYLKV